MNHLRLISRKTKQKAALRLPVGVHLVVARKVAAAARRNRVANQNVDLVVVAAKANPRKQLRVVGANGARNVARQVQVLQQQQQPQMAHQRLVRVVVPRNPPGVVALRRRKGVAVVRRNLVGVARREVKPRPMLVELQQQQGVVAVPRKKVVVVVRRKKAVVVANRNVARNASVANARTVVKHVVV
jgi:hypothetical protein